MPSSPMRSTKYNYLALMADDGLLRVGGRPVDVDEHGCGRRRPCRRCRRHDNVRHAKGVVERRPPPPPPSRRRGPCRLTTPATRHAPPMPLVGLVVVLHHLTPPPLICRHLSLRHHLLCLSSVRLVVTSPRFSRCHIPSASAPASHRYPAIASCHAPLRPLIRLVKASPLLMPPPPICGIIESSQRSGLMVV